MLVCRYGKQRAEKPHDHRFHLSFQLTVQLVWKILLYTWKDGSYIYSYILTLQDTDSRHQAFAAQLARAPPPALLMCIRTTPKYS